MPHYYTVEEANARLPQLTELLRQMQTHGLQLAELQRRASKTKMKMRGNGYHNPAEDPLVVQSQQWLEEQLKAELQQLADWEIHLKDLERGLVDFPALREGREVFLCWELSEDRVRFWHEVEAGYAGRQPLDEQVD